MSDIATPLDTGQPGKRSRWRLALVLALTLLLAAGGFYASWSGLVPVPGHSTQDAAESPAPLPDIAFVPIDPVIISLPPGASSRHLKFTAQLEVEKPLVEEVGLLMPRIRDVLNSYLRAVDLQQVGDPAALTRLRAQMLRRVQIVTGQGRVRDLLISEFVLD